MKIGTAGLSHETHTFLPEPTEMDSFETAAVRGREVIETFRGTNTAMGGFVAASDEHGFGLEPVVHARGGVSGTVRDAVYDRYVEELRDGFAAMAGEIDGVALFLHGAMVTESRQDPEWDIVREVGEVVGDDTPIAVAMDLHGNVSEGMLADVTAVCAYRSSPHVDSRETGRRSIDVLRRTIEGEVSPTTAISKPGLVVPSPFSATTTVPARDVVTRCLSWERMPELYDVTRWDRRDDVLDVSVFFGFTWSDVEQLGVSAVAVTDDDPELAETIADDVAAFAWDCREGLTDPDDLYSVEAGVDRALTVADSAADPVLLLDAADRLSETTFVLRELVERGAENVAVPLLYDPDAADACARAGEGNTVTVAAGSSSSDRGGGPVELTGTVEWVGHRPYTATGPMRQGQRIDHGRTAILDVDGIWVQLVSNPTTGLIDRDPIEQYGYDVESFDVVVSKSKTHFRAVYEDLAAEIVIVDAPEYSPADLSSFDYENVPDGVYPIDRSV